MSFFFFCLNVSFVATGSAFPDDADSLMCVESGEPSFTQSEVLTCAEESSLILFTEESECFSEPDDISRFVSYVISQS